jgi:hypothetical protein
MSAVHGGKQAASSNIAHQTSTGSWGLNGSGAESDDNYSSPSPPVNTTSRLQPRLDHLNPGIMHHKVQVHNYQQNQRSPAANDLSYSMAGLNLSRRPVTGLSTPPNPNVACPGILHHNSITVSSIICFIMSQSFEIKIVFRGFLLFAEPISSKNAMPVAIRRPMQQLLLKRRA